MRIMGTCIGMPTERCIRTNDENKTAQKRTAPISPFKTNFRPFLRRDSFCLKMERLTVYKEYFFLRNVKCARIFFVA